MRKSVRGVLGILLTIGSANVAMAQGAAKLHTTPNSVKYKNAGAKPATGRSGSAMLEARVLIAKDNTMMLEASTAGVDAATHPGSITKMQVKIGADFTQNHNALTGGGYWTGTMPAALRATAIQLQANIKGIDPKRNDVVTVSAPALLRPDVAVMSVANQPTAAPNAQVVINATVAERNGDVGARGACVLSIDGAVTATTSNIWIDAGDTVNCQFTHAFAQPGTHAISVSVTGVNPADWDAANNTAASTINIVSPSQQIPNGYMQAYQQDHEWVYEYSRTGGYYCNYGYSYYCSSTSPYSQQRRDRYKYSQLYFSGGTALATPLATSFELKVLTNGNVSDNATLAPNADQPQAYDDGNYFEACRQYYSAPYWNGNNYVYSPISFSMCTGGYRPNNQLWTNYWFERVNGTVSYFHRENGYIYTNHSYSYGNGQDLGWTSGTELRVQLAYVDASGIAQTVDKSLTLNQNSDYDYVNGPAWGYDPYEGNWYRYELNRQVSVYGFVNWNNQQ